MVRGFFAIVGRPAALGVGRRVAIEANVGIKDHTAVHVDVGPAGVAMIATAAVLEGGRIVDNDIAVHHGPLVRHGGYLPRRRWMDAERSRI